MEQSAVCAVCKTGHIRLVETPAAGWASDLTMLYSNALCFRSSKSTVKSASTSQKQGHQHDVNKLMVIAMRTIGRGQSAATKFSAILGLPKPITRTTFAKYTKMWAHDSLRESEQKLVEVGKELRQLIRNNNDNDNDEEILDCSVSIDGSWLTRGRHSKHGFVSVISDITGKVIDRVHKCSACKECERWKNRDEDDIEYLEWFNAHEPDCSITHQGSSQAMEASGAVQLFRRSVERHKLRYKTFIGDGDAKSYDTVVKGSSIWPNICDHQGRVHWTCAEADGDSFEELSFKVQR